MPISFDGKFGALLLDIHLHDVGAPTECLQSEGNRCPEVLVHALDCPSA